MNYIKWKDSLFCHEGLNAALLTNWWRLVTTLAPLRSKDRILSHFCHQMWGEIWGMDLWILGWSNFWNGQNLDQKTAYFMQNNVLLEIQVKFLKDKIFLCWKYKKIQNFLPYTNFSGEIFSRIFWKWSHQKLDIVQASNSFLASLSLQCSLLH